MQRMITRQSPVRPAVPPTHPNPVRTEKKYFHTGIPSGVRESRTALIKKSLVINDQDTCPHAICSIVQWSRMLGGPIHKMFRVLWGGCLWELECIIGGVKPLWFTTFHAHALTSTGPKLGGPTPPPPLAKLGGAMATLPGQASN